MADAAEALNSNRTTTAPLLLGPATIFIAIMIVGPLLLIATVSLSRFDALSLAVEAFTLRNYFEFFTDRYYLGVVLTTVTVATVSTLSCLLIGFPMAYRLARGQTRYKGLLIILLTLPLFISGTIRTIGWMILFARDGLLNAAIGVVLPGVSTELMYTTTAVVIGSVSILLPYMVLTLQSAIEGIEPRLEEAASGMGAPPATVFRRVIWPLALPGAAIGSILCFTMSMNTYATAVLLGGPRFHMMAPLVYYEFTVRNNWSMAGVAAMVLLVANLALAIGLTRTVKKRYRG